jgi:hypothetical protein
LWLKHRVEIEVVRLPIVFSGFGRSPPEEDAPSEP